VAERDVEWKNNNSAPLEGNRTRDVDPGRKEISQRIEDADQRARQSREIPVRQGNPFRRWNPER